jgi:hypothetical protein
LLAGVEDLKRSCDLQLARGGGARAGNTGYGSTFARLAYSDWASPRGRRIFRIGAIERQDIVIGTPRTHPRLRYSDRAHVYLVLAKIFAIDLTLEKVVKVLLGNLYARFSLVEARSDMTFPARRALAWLAQLTQPSE